MTSTGTSARFELLASVNLTSNGVSGSAQIGVPMETVVYTTTPNIFYSMVAFITAGETFSVDFATGAVAGEIAGTNQVETATVVAASGITADGVCNVVFTSDNIAGSPFTVPVTLTTAQTTPTLIATEIKLALAANVSIASLYTIGSDLATVTATRTDKRSNVASLNIAIPAGLGITAAPTSVDTTAGVGEVKATRINGLAWDMTDHEGLPLEEATKLYSVVVRCSGGSGTTVDITSAGYASGEITPFALCRFNDAGNNPWIAGDVTFTPDEDVTIAIDVHAGT